MTTRQKITIEQSEVREKINAILGKEKRKKKTRMN